MEKIINCAQLWRERMARKTAAGNSYQSPETARSYDRSVSIWEDGYKRAELLPVTSSDSVLDIGCGPGVLAIPLAKKAKSVTVVEPSGAMLDLLRQHCREENIRNITALQASWEEVDDRALPSFDYVIASYSLAMLDIQGALAAMDRIAAKRVYLYWFSGLASWEKLMVDLYPVVYQVPFHVQPKSDLLMGVLDQMGIHAHLVHLDGTSFDRCFRTLEAAVEDLKKRLHLSTAEFDSRLADYVRSHYLRDGDGWIFRDQTDYVQLFWTPGQQRRNCRVEERMAL